MFRFVLYIKKVRFLFTRSVEVFEGELCYTKEYLRKLT